MAEWSLWSAATRQRDPLLEWADSPLLRQEARHQDGVCWHRLSSAVGIRWHRPPCCISASVRWCSYCMHCTDFMDVAKVMATGAMAPYLNDPVYTRWNGILTNFNITSMGVAWKNGYEICWKRAGNVPWPPPEQNMATCLTDLLQQTLGYEMWISYMNYLSLEKSLADHP